MFADTPQVLREILQERIRHRQRKALARQVPNLLRSPVVDSMATTVGSVQTRTSLARVQAYRLGLLESFPLRANVKVKVYLPNPFLKTVVDMPKKVLARQHWKTCDTAQTRPYLQRRESTKVCGTESDETKSMRRTPVTTTSTLHHPLMLPNKLLTGDLVLQHLTPA